MHGVGEFYWPDNKKYIGQYVKDKKEGFGMFMWSENPLKAYIGFWQDGKQSGVGIMISKKTIKYAFWKNGEKIIQFQGPWEMEKFVHKMSIPFNKFLLKNINELTNYLLDGFINPDS